MAPATEAATAPPPLRLAGAVAHFPAIAGAFSVIVGLLELTGWIEHINRLIEPVPGIPVMVPTSALAAVFAGASLWLRGGTGRAHPRRGLSRIAAGVTFLIGFATVIENAAHLSFGFDHLIASWSVGPWSAVTPTLHTALASTFTGLALFYVDRVTKHGHYVSEILALIPGTIAVIVLLGYLFKIPAFYGETVRLPLVAMSPLTAIVLLAVFVGILAVHVDHGVAAIAIARDAGGVAARWLLLGLALFPPLAMFVIVGARLQWYSLPVASALMLFFALAEGTVFALTTARRMSRADAEQRRFANELRESEAREHALVEQAKDGIFVADLDGRYTDVNPAGCAMLGYTREDIIGKTIADLIPPEEVSRLEHERVQAGSPEGSRGEWELRHRDGYFISVEVVAKILPDRRWQAIVRDITERKRAAKQLGEAFEGEQQLRADLEAVDRARAVVSEALAKLSGSEIEPVLQQIAEQARVLTDAAHAAIGIGVDPTREFDHWQIAGIPDEIGRAIGRRPLPNQPTPHGMLAMPIHARGQIIGNLYVANKHGGGEFSERDERLVSLLGDGVALAIEAARSYAFEAGRRAWLQSIIDHLPEGVIVADETRSVRAINRVMMEWAYDPNVPVEQMWANPAMFDVRDARGAIVPLDDLPIVRALVTREATGEEEFQLHLRDGRMVPIAARAVPIRDEEDHSAGAVVVVRDISERKELEQLREEWIAIVAHDLRQPVSAIVSAVGLLRDHLARDKEPEILDRMHEVAYRLNRMVGDLLDDARIAAHRLKLECVMLDVVPVVARAIDQLRLANPSVQVTLRAPESCRAWIDPERIEQVLANLFSNAVKYRTPGTTIEVEVEAFDGARIGVFSEGIPIAREELPYLFSRFQRTRTARAGLTPGLGLGLYICKGVVEAHGGSIWIESDNEKTRVYFTLLGAPAAAEPLPVGAAG